MFILHKIFNVDNHKICGLKCTRDIAPIDTTVYLYKKVKTSAKPKYNIKTIKMN